jgi:hypothetical protein
MRFVIFIWVENNLPQAITVRPDEMKTTFQQIARNILKLNPNDADQYIMEFEKTLRLHIATRIFSEPNSDFPVQFLIEGSGRYLKVIFCV